MTHTTIPGGLLVAIEGIDGAGKTTLARSLRRELEGVGLSVTTGKEPTTGPWGKRLRDSAATGRLSAGDEVKFLLRDRQQHVTDVILPALSRGEVVILDRYFPSMVAYQGARGYDIKRLLAANDFAPSPDLTILLDVDPSIGLGRIVARGDVPNSFETPDNLERARKIFLELPIDDVVRIDGHQSEADVFSEAQLRFYLAVAAKIAAAKGISPEAAGDLLKVLPALHA